MANIQKGEVSFKALEKDWTIKLGTNAMCEIEDATGLSINDIGNKLNGESFNMKLMRTVFVSGMIEFHADIDERTVGNVIDDIGFDEAAKIMERAFVFATPEKKGGTKKGNPTAAPA